MAIGFSDGFYPTAYGVDPSYKYYLEREYQRRLQDVQQMYYGQWSDNTQAATQAPSSESTEKRKKLDHLIAHYYHARH